MPLFTSSSFESLDHLLIDQLQDLYDAEQRLTNAQPRLAEAATDPRLKNALREHLTETERQLETIEALFAAIEQPPRAKTCDAMKGLIREAEETIGAQGEPAVKDAAIIAASQRIAHYEMAAFGTARTIARRLAKEDVAQKLQQCLDEEKAVDFRLTQLAEESINPAAAHAS